MRKHIAIAAILSALSLTAAPVAAFAQNPNHAAVDPSGDWHGLLSAGDRHLRIGMHLGAVSTFDSLDQRALGLPSHLTVDGRHVRVVVERGAVFEGDLSEDSARLVGILRQGDRTLPLSLERGNFDTQSVDQAVVDASGDWRGIFNSGPFRFRFALHLGATSSFDSLDRNMHGMPAEMRVEGRHVRVLVPHAGMFEGDLSEDGARLDGGWRGSATATPVPISFERGAYEARQRPQTPVGPFPYRAEEVGYDNPARPGVHLAGTLTLPKGNGPFPAMLLITGSGAQDRDETLFDHKHFLVLADYLTRRGIAVLRVDDRGVGGSTGASPNDTSADYATDVEAGVAFLKTRHDIDPTRIGLIGHSEGGLIAPMVASHDPSIAALVLWAGPGVSGEDVMVEQVRASVLATGASAESGEINARVERGLLDAALIDPEADARTAVANAMAKLGFSEAARSANMQRLFTPWFRAFIAYNPQPALRSLRIPVLALLAEKDVQVVASQNGPALTATLAGNPHARVVVLPGLNHLFQTATTGSPGEYEEIEETIAPAALRTMGDWLVETLAPSPRR